MSAAGGLTVMLMPTLVGVMDGLSVLSVGTLIVSLIPLPPHRPSPVPVHSD
jgi:hypothetical protein